MVRYAALRRSYPAVDIGCRANKGGLTGGRLTTLGAPILAGISELRSFSRAGGQPAGWLWDYAYLSRGVHVGP